MSIESQRSAPTTESVSLDCSGRPALRHDPSGELAAIGNETECTVQEPIPILEDHGELGFTWDDPVTGEPRLATPPRV